MIRHIYNAPCGKLLLEVISGKVCRCSWMAGQLAIREERRPLTGDIYVMEEAIAQLDEYFRGERTIFNIPLLMGGTLFRRKVWKFLQTIPCGQTMAYGEIAELCGCPGGQRAVAQACGANNLAILVPCHRVVRADGSLGGYTVTKEGTEKGKRPVGLAIKQYLLTHETTLCGRDAAESPG